MKTATLRTRFLATFVVALFAILALGTTASAAPIQQDDVDPYMTTTSLSPQGDVGRIIPLPNSGSEPRSPTDRGGLFQIGLFLLICAVIIAMGIWVWLKSREARTERGDAGLSRVEVARAHGADVRQPPQWPPDSGLSQDSEVPQDSETSQNP